MISISILTGPNKNQDFEIEKDTILIGRSNENDIKLRDGNVSRTHLKVFREQEQYFIMDLESKNGTYINNEQAVPNSKIMITEPTPILIGTSVLCVGKECKDNIKPYFYMVDIAESDEDGLRHSVLNYEQNIDLMKELSDVLTHTPSASEMMERTLGIISQISESINRAALIMVDPETGNILESSPKITSSGNDNSFSYDLEVVNHVLKTKKPFWFLDAFEEHDDGISETLKVTKMRSVICFPMFRGSKALGVMYVDSLEKPNSFKKEEVYLMKLFSEKISLRLAGLRFSTDRKPVLKERRRHKRYKTFDDLYVFFDFYSSTTGHIFDISEGGISFLYTGNKDWSEGLDTVDITTSDYLFSIKDLPVKAIWESETTSEDFLMPVGARRCGLQFRNLNPDQTSRLKDFIEIQVSKAKYLKK